MNTASITGYDISVAQTVGIYPTVPSTSALRLTDPHFVQVFVPLLFILEPQLIVTQLSWIRGECGNFWPGLPVSKGDRDTYIGLRLGIVIAGSHSRNSSNALNPQENQSDHGIAPRASHAPPLAAP